MLLAEGYLDRNSWITGIAVPVLVGIAVLAIERYWHRKERNTKTFDYRVISDIPIFTERDRPQDLKVTYNDATRLAFKRNNVGHGVDLGRNWPSQISGQRNVSVDVVAVDVERRRMCCAPTTSRPA